MRPDEPRHIEPDDHEIDLGKADHVRDWTEKLDATHDELAEAVEAVVQHRHVVLLFRDVRRVGP